MRLPVAGEKPRLSIETPRGTPAEGSALEPVMVSAAPPERFTGVTVRIDGAVVHGRVRRLSDQIMVSAWCDTRGLPPGLHRIEVIGVLDDGGELRATRLLVVVTAERATALPIPAALADAPPVDVVRVADGRRDALLARTAAGGPALVLLDGSCELAPGAAARIAAAFADPAGVDVVIGDEAAMIGEHRWMRWRKPAFAPDALPSIDQVGPLLAVGPRAAAVLATAQPPITDIYGCALELLDRGLLTFALPHVLALTAEPRMPTDDHAARAAIERLARRRGRPVAIGPGPVAGTRDVRWPLSAPPPVVAIVASCTPALAERCLRGLADRTDYDDLRAVLVDSNGDQEAMRRLASGARVPTGYVRYPAGEPFNYQRAVNLGVTMTERETVLFLNDDVFPLRPDWLTRMVELVTLPGVGVVGAMLRFPDGRIQHAGVRVGSRHGHLYHDAPADTRGHRFELMVPGNPEAVTGACMLVRRETLEQLGGHDDEYVHVYGDVDLCFRAAERGWRIAWACSAELEHRESATYGTAFNGRDVTRFTARWRRDRDRTASSRVRA